MSGGPAKEGVCIIVVEELKRRVRVEKSVIQYSSYEDESMWFLLRI